MAVLSSVKEVITVSLTAVEAEAWWKLAKNAREEAEQRIAATIERITRDFERTTRADVVALVNNVPVEQLAAVKELLERK